MSNKIEYIKSELIKKGFPLENYVQSILSKNGWEVQANPYYMDKDTKKGKEFDIKATYEPEESTTWTTFFPKILIECKKIPGNAWIFFSSEEEFTNTLHSGLSNWLQIYDHWLFLSTDNHSYETFTTNYSEIILDPKNSNKRDKNIWKSVITLIKAASEEIESDFLDCKQYLLEIGSYNYFINNPCEIVYPIYPIIIFEGDLFEASFASYDEIILKNKEYIRLFVDYKSGRYKTKICIDIMKKERLTDYLEEIKKDVKTFNKRRENPENKKTYENDLFEAVKKKFDEIYET